MIEPPGTSCPPKAFTPRRCAFESRPFLELPSPFLCAIELPLSYNLVDGDARKVLPVADRPLVLFLAFELENQDFFAAPVRRDGPFDRCAFERRAGLHRIAVHYCQDAAELHRGS